MSATEPVETRPWCSSAGCYHYAVSRIGDRDVCGSAGCMERARRVLAKKDSAAFRRAEAQRIVNAEADRLMEVLAQYGVRTEDVDREDLLGWACYVVGRENDYIDDED